jgi:DNA-binding GntR family transcriptional regulator
MKALRRATLAEQAYEELQAQIVSGRLPAGRRLLAEELATQLDISPTPVKEALALLERDGLVLTEARLGSVVRRFTASDIAEIYDARILIETHAVAAGVKARRVTPAYIDGLQATYEAQIAHAERRNNSDLAEAIRLDRSFHEALVSLGANRIMAGWHRAILRQTQTARSYSLERYDVDRARAEHATIIAAFREGGAAAAIVRALRDHLVRSRAEMLSRAPDELPPRP